MISGILCNKIVFFSPKNTSTVYSVTDYYMSITPQIGFFTKAPSGNRLMCARLMCATKKKETILLHEIVMIAFCQHIVGWQYWPDEKKIWVSDFSLLVWWTTGAPNSDKLSTRSSFKSALQTLTLRIIGGFPVSVQLAKWKTTYRYCKRDREYMRVFFNNSFFFFNSLLHPGAVEKWLMWTVLEYLNRAL